MPPAATPKLSIAAREFITFRTRRGNGSRDVARSYRSILGRLTAATNDIHVRSLTPVHVEEFFYGLNGLADTCGSTTLAKYRTDLRAFLDFCYRREWLRQPPDVLLGGVSDTSTQANRDRFRLTRGELVELLEGAEDPRDRGLVAFCQNTAVRIGEALGLKVRDLNLDRGQVYVKRPKVRDEITYPVTADLDEEMRRWLAVYTAEMAQAGGTLAPGHYLFPPRPQGRFQAGGLRIVDQPRGYAATRKLTNPNRLIRPIAERVGIDLGPGDGWHTIRRSVARIFFDDCVSDGYDQALRLVQALLGHKQVSTTERYLGLDLEKAKVDQILRGQAFIRKGLTDGTVIRLSDRRVS